MAKGKAPKKGSKNKKYERNLKKCQRYVLEGREEKNKLRSLRRHLRTQVNDLVARAAFNRITANRAGASAPVPLSKLAA